jgi:ribonucleoside-diphosphate reductase alpha chain
MGFADMLIKLGVGYGTEQGRRVAERVMGVIQTASHDASYDLAVEKGVFPNFAQSVFCAEGRPQRNAAVTTVAPTGAISMIFDVSGGLEPYFALAYYYKGILGGSVQLSYVNKHLRAALEAEGIYTPELMDRICNAKCGSVAGMPEVPAALQKVLVTSMDISADAHILMQAAFQRECDNSISKTINFPNSATHADCAAGYIKAWQNGCKGCTVYRDGSRDLQVLNTNASKEEPTNGPEAPEPTPPSSPLSRSSDGCPDCPSPLVRSEGCLSCSNCGYSACERG